MAGVSGVVASAPVDWDVLVPGGAAIVRSVDICTVSYLWAAMHHLELFEPQIRHGYGVCRTKREQARSRTAPVPGIR